jgi:adenylate cyclase
MNFIQIKRHIVSFFLGLIIFPYLAYPSTRRVDIDEIGIPLIQKYPFPASCISSGKMSVFEDPSGFFLLGARDKIILFYGNEFIPLYLQGQINVISNQKAVFYTGYNSLGIIRLYKNSLPQLIPLVDRKLSKNFDFGQIDKVYLDNDIIIFNNHNCLFLTSDGSSFSLIDSSKHFIQLFRVNDTIFYNKYESGIFKIIEGQPLPISVVEEIKEKNIICILPYKNSLLIKAKENKYFFQLNNKSLKTVEFGFEDFLEKAGFTDALFLPSGNFAIATKSAGILIYNPEKKTINKIGIEEGLIDNEINNLHIDKAGNLWALHNSGLSRIELNVPVSTFGSDVGLSGAVTSILKYNNILYVATSNGLFKGDYKEIHGAGSFNKLYFTRIVDIVNGCKKLFIDKGNLLAFTASSIYSVNNNSAKVLYIAEINACERITFREQDFYCIGNDTGLTFLEYKNGKIIEKPFINGPAYQITEIALDKNHIWVKTSSNSLLYANMLLFNNLKTVQFQLFDTLKGFPAPPQNFYFLQTADGLKFCFPDKILQYNDENKRLETSVTEMPGDLEEIPRMNKLLKDKYNNIWFNISGTIENLRGILLYKTDENKNEKPFFFNTGSALSPIYIDSSTVWIGGENKVIRFDNSKTFNFPRKFSAIIKRIIIGKDSVLRINLEDPEINFRLNNIKFIVSSTCFEGEPFVRYQFRLEGFDNNWSKWDRSSEIQFNNLPPGNYSLQLKALNVDGIVSDVTELNFSILSPFYLTIPAYLIYVIILLFIAFVVMRYRTWRFLNYKEKIERIVQERTEEIIKEKDKSELLIANLLPKGTADELKLTGKATSQKFTMATVLFSDIQGFTKIAEQMNPELLIDQLDAFFFHFDSVVEKYNIEKIKTIGDAYMCAGGIPNKNITNPVEVVLAALEMQEYMAELKRKNADIWDLRIGIHTGSVIAGVVGHKKMSYDIWGDTVNTASRMESSGEVGKINISGHTYELVKDFFVCEYRGKMPVKYKGEIDMYFVKSIRPELASDMKFDPNRKFFLMLQILRLQDVEDDVYEKISKELPSNLHFHTLDRIKEVYNLVDLYSRAEELSDEESLLVRTAALFADTGYIWTYDEHEEMSISYARELLPKFKYSDEQIEKIAALIEATKRARKPSNRMEEILLDADMNFLARADFVSLNELLYQELKEKNKIESREDWIKMQVVLLSNHKYYTKVANVLRDVNPEQQIDNLLQNT